MEIKIKARVATQVNPQVLYKTLRRLMTAIQYNAIQLI